MIDLSRISDLSEVSRGLQPKYYPDMGKAEFID